MDYKERIEEKRQKLVNTFIDFIENNPTHWEAGWYKVATVPPFNGKSEKAYKGLNALYLCVLSMIKGYRDPRWVSFNQAKELGGNVKSGEKSSEIFYWSFYDKATKKPYEEKTCEGMAKKERLEYWEKNVRPVIKFYQVFNAEQCENLPEYKRETTPEMEAEERKRQNAVIEQIIANSDAPVNYDGGNRAYYSPAEDSIHLPEIKDFKTMQDYYATALHEIAHSTGHESRLNRNLLGFFGTSDYAKEELRAELASVFMQVEYGISIEGRHFENHGAYLAGWLKSVKDNKNDFFAAATDAEKITSYISDNYLQNIKEPKFEANTSFARQVDAVLSGADATSTHLKVMGTPLILRQLGAQNIPVLMTAKHLKNIVADSGDDNGVNYHGIDVDLIKKLPKLLSDPVMVMDSLTRDDSVVIVTSAVDKENRPIIGAIKFDGFGNLNDIEIDANILTSTYGRNNFNYFIKRNVDENKILYWDKEKSQELIKTPGLQLPDNLNSLTTNTIIRKAKAFVNSLGEKIENIPVDEAKKAEKRNAKTEQAIDKMSDNVVISSEVLATRQEMLNIIWSGYGNDYYAVSNEKILIPDEDDERDNGFVEVDGQAVYVIDEYGSIQQNQVGQKLTSYDININLPYYSQRDYKQIPLEDLQRIADERAAKITAYAQALKEVERKSEKPVHNDLYFLKIAKQELDKHYADFHSVEPFYGKYMRTQVDNPEAIVLKRLGDFYEAMGDKAAQVAATLDLTLTGRDVGLSERVAMCGFPYHIADEYIAKLRESSDVIVDDKYLVKSKRVANEYKARQAQEQANQVDTAEQVEQAEQVNEKETIQHDNLNYNVEIYPVLGTNADTVNAELKEYINRPMDIGKADSIIEKISKNYGINYEHKSVENSDINLIDDRFFSVRFAITSNKQNRLLYTGSVDNAEGQCGIIEKMRKTETAILESDFYSTMEKKQARENLEILIPALELEKSKINELAEQVDTVEQARQVGQVGLVKIELSAENKLKEYGKATMFRIPKGLEFSSFVFLASTKFVGITDKGVTLSVPADFEFTLQNNGREVRLTGEELRANFAGQKTGKSAQRGPAAKRNAARLDALRTNAPAEMREMPNWCVFKTKWNYKKGKKDKYILSPIDGKWARSNAPEDWTDFETAYKYAVENNCEGLAFALDNSGIACIDLDKCIIDGKMNGIADQLSGELKDTYCEKSVSGNGLHFFVKDDILGDKYRNRADTPQGELEVYQTGRFISMTGNVVGATTKLSKCPTATISHLRKTLGTKIQENVGPRSTSSSNGATSLRYQSDAEVIERIRRSKKGNTFDTLYSGGSITGDKSRDDLAMLNTLAFFTDCNESQMRSIFESSARFRPDTKNAAYLDRSIKKACQSLTIRLGEHQNGAQSRREK